MFGKSKFVACFVVGVAFLMTDVHEGLIKDCPRYALASLSGQEPSVEVLEFVLRPVCSGEVVTKSRLVQVADTHGEIERMRLHETSFFVQRDWLLVDVRPRVDDVIADVVDSIGDELILGLFDYGGTSPRRGICLHHVFFFENSSR